MIEDYAKLFNFVKCLVNFDEIGKSLENQYRILINRIFMQKTVQFTELLYTHERIARKKLTEIRRKRTKA